MTAIRSSERDEDILLTIYELGRIWRTSWVNLSTLAAELDCAPVTVAHVARELEEWELAIYCPERGIALTTAGKKAARRVERYRWFIEFNRQLQLYQRGRCGLLW
jgi:Mn-dependent DtxR family transcriptional regulator